MTTATLERTSPSRSCLAPAFKFAVAPTLQDESFLKTLLPYALAQSQRHGEPLSLFCLAIDRWSAIRELLGTGIALEAVRLVGQSVVGALRAGDIVARLEDGRLAAILPGAAQLDALAVAEAVRARVADAGRESQTMPLLTVSIGTATFPNHGWDGLSLLAKAAEALADAHTRGRNRISSVP